MATFGGMIMLLIGSSLHIIPRMADTPLSNETNAGLMAMVFTGGILLFVIGSQVQNDIGNMIAFAGYNIPALAALAIIANLLLTQSYRLAEASLVTPIKYLSLVFAIVFGFLIWSEIPKLLTLFGALLVITSSLIIFMRENKLKKQIINPRP